MSWFYRQVFKGNRNNNSVVINSIPNPVEARYVRFIPQSWKNSIALRVEVYGEVTGLSFFVIVIVCLSVFGSNVGSVKDQKRNLFP